MAIVKKEDLASTHFGSNGAVPSDGVNVDNIPALARLIKYLNLP